ncbi:MAG: sensor histidine kinase [Gammaproteobacteria bacterium]
MNRFASFFALRHSWAAITTWAVISGLTLFAIRDAASPYNDLVVETVALQLLYLVAMMICGSKPEAGIPDWARRGGLVVLLAAGLALGMMLPLSFLPIYTIIWLAFTPGHMNVRWAHVAFIGVNVAWYLIEKYLWGNNDPLLSISLFATFHYFALLSAIETQNAEKARARAESLNRELVATQHLLAEASKQGERTRIARDLHDLLGHHLTALTINLQVAERVCEGEARERVNKCHTLASDMLQDVRAAVTTLRDDSAVNFAEALSLVVENIPQLKMHLDIDEHLRIDDVNVAESLLRCVQEAITNTLRHAAASECTVRVWREDGRLHLRVHDNGHVAAGWQPGNGLRGMRERVERIDGELLIERVRDALAIHIQIPLAA